MSPPVGRRTGSPRSRKRGARGGALAASRLIWARGVVAGGAAGRFRRGGRRGGQHRASWAVTIAFCRRASKSRSGEKQAERVLAWGLEGDPRRGISGAGERLWKQHVRHGERGMEVADSAREPWFEQLAAWLCEPLARKDDTPSWVKFGHDVGRAVAMAGVIECERLIGVHASTRTREGLRLTQPLPDCLRQGGERRRWRSPPVGEALGGNGEVAGRCLRPAARAAGLTCDGFHAPQLRPDLNRPGSVGALIGGLGGAHGSGMVVRPRPDGAPPESAGRPASAGAERSCSCWSKNSASNSALVGRRRAFREGVRGCRSRSEEGLVLCVFEAREPTPGDEL